MATLTLLRHGESQWNRENRFTGWVDVDLSPVGEDEARNAGTILATLPIDAVYTSVLLRAKRTADLALAAAGKSDLPRTENAALNERHYGDLQGLNKAETAERFGAEQVHQWRRSYDVAPPNGESLKDTLARVAPYYETTIKPLLLAGRNVLVVAHGNSLRSLIMLVEGIAPADILSIELPTGTPISYELDKDGTVVSKTLHQYAH